MARTKKKRTSILIVDDEQAILQSFQMLLKMEGYDVETAPTGKMGLEKAGKKVYNLAIIDVRLPDMDGTKLLEQLHEISPNTRMVMITGYPSIDSATAAVNLGAYAYLVKPVIPQDFLEIVRLKLQEERGEEVMTRERVMDWVETRHLQSKHESPSSEKNTARRQQ